MHYLAANQQVLNAHSAALFAAILADDSSDEDEEDAGDQGSHILRRLQVAFPALNDPEAEAESDRWGGAGRWVVARR